MKIHDVYAFDAKAASREVLKFGFTAVDDIGQGLFDCARDELLDALGHASDHFDLVTDKIESPVGPVFVFRDPARVTRAKAKAFVLAATKI